MDSRDSLDQTPDSIDLTKSPVKHKSPQRLIEKINEDTSDNDTDEMITFDEEKVKKTSRKDINVQGVTSLYISWTLLLLYGSLYRSPAY